MGLRDRGLRLAGYLTPPSDLAQEDDDNAERYHCIALHCTCINIYLLVCCKLSVRSTHLILFYFIFCSSRMVPTLEKIESGKVWSPSLLVPSTAATMTTVMRSAEQEKIRDSLRLEDLKIVTPKVNTLSIYYYFTILIEIIPTQV